MKRGFLQALGIVLYCGLIGAFFWNANKIFPPKDTFLAPIAMLTLFSTSALICSLIVFYRPYKLFFEGKKKEAIDVVVNTAIFLFVFLTIILTSLVFIK